MNTFLVMARDSENAMNLVASYAVRMRDRGTFGVKISAASAGISY
jgi:hypothetical protein